METVSTTIAVVGWLGIAQPHRYKKATMENTIIYVVHLRVAQLGHDAFGYDSVIHLSVEPGMAECLKAAIDATVEQVIGKMKLEAAIG